MRKYIPFIMAALAVACEPTELDIDNAVLTTGDAIEITYNSAYLSGGAAAPRNCNVWFEVSLFSDMYIYWCTETCQMENPDLDHAKTVSIKLDELTPNTTYYYRLCGGLQYDGYQTYAGKGEIRSFKTDKNPPAKARIYVDSESGADFVDYLIVEDGKIVEGYTWHPFDGWSDKTYMRYIDTQTAVSEADVYMCQLSDSKSKVLSDFNVSVSLTNGAFYYGHTTVSSAAPSAECRMSRATCEVNLNVTCKSKDGYIDDGNIYQVSLVNAAGVKTAPICYTGLCDLLTGRITGVADPKATVSTSANIWLNSSKTYKVTFPAVIPATAAEGDAELRFYVKSSMVSSPISVPMPAFVWTDGNTYTYDITVNYTAQGVELVIENVTVTAWNGHDEGDIEIFN